MKFKRAKKLKKLAKENGTGIRVDEKRGKVSHVTLFYGGKQTSIPKGELKKGTLMVILKQLGIDKGSL
ncbi:MAG: type II toxin-antitoxin system HicA family toxin [Thermodesulfobacteriota bacterium]|nr:type II toxin-antitoxin system HicA family toxin [Thermodesulfobacteriota bacterium]